MASVSHTGTLTIVLKRVIASAPFLAGITVLAYLAFEGLDARQILFMDGQAFSYGLGRAARAGEIAWLGLPSH
ncbi:MAG: hypothetical protein EBZ48_00795 [Proteobacteria bacterium]|nr:hypothetical protein [Pseudomonadota bacterium]